MKSLEPESKFEILVVPAVFFVIAFLVRTAYVVYSGLDLVPDVDSVEYIGYAENLVAGNGYTDGRWRAFRAPGYPFFAAGVFYLFGKSISVLKMAQVVISSFVPVLIYFVGFRLGGRRVAFMAGIFSCFYLGLVFEPYHLLSESVFTPLLVLAILLLLKGDENWRYPLLSGAVLGLVLLARPVAQLVLLVAFLWLLVTLPARRAFKSAALIFLGVFLVMSPWWVRNYRVFGAFVPVCIETGYVFKLTNLPVEMHQTNDHLPELARDRQSMKDGLEYVKSLSFGTFLKKGIIEVLGFLHPFMPLYDLTYVFVIPFMLYGVYFVVKSWNTGALLLFTGFMYLPVAFAFCGTARHRHSMGPFFILLAALGAQALWEKYRGTPVRARVFAGLAGGWALFNIAILFYPGPLRMFLKSLVGRS